MKTHNPSLFFSIVVFVVLCFTRVPIAHAASLDKSSLDSWIGQYVFVEAPAGRYVWRHEIAIHKEGEEYYAKITVDGTQTNVRVQANVVGDSISIQLVFNKYLDDHMFGTYEQGQLLLTLKMNGSKVLTEWATLKPIATEPYDTGFFFDKLATQNRSDADNNLQGKNEQPSAWFGFDSIFLGGVVSNKWITVDEFFNAQEYKHIQMQKRDTCTVYSPDGHAGKGSVTAMYSGIPGNDTQRFDVQLKNGAVLGPGSTRLASNCSWNPMPRQPVIMSPNNAAYATIVRNYLARNGLPNVEPNIVQLIKVDLEGDGVDEMIICAQNIVAQDATAFTWGQGKNLIASGIGFPSGSVKGDYSLLLLRKIVNGQVREIPLGNFIALKNATPADAEQISPPLYKVYQFADLNGDGTMEIILGKNYYESISYSVLEIKNDKVVEVLTSGMGF